MCGIVGLYYRNAACDQRLLTSMRDTLAHRGPDDAGNYVAGPLGLGQRRLSIIDLSPAGHQPMQTPDGRFVISFNGEIYNYRELRDELERQGVRFLSQSDTEVVLQLHAMEGDAAVERLNGIFAYALWDTRERRLLLARDRAGIKPLYYSASPAGFAFASEIKALFESNIVQPRMNEARVAEYLLFRQVAGQENLFADVYALPPGHTMEVHEGRPSPPRRYWSIQDRPEPFEGDYHEAVDALDATLNRAVARQLMSDVPLGTFCSGGIDSSLTTAIAARHTSHPINTFSVGFHEAAFDESEYARLAASSCRTVHHELRIDEGEYAELLPKLIWHHDLPLNFANSVHIYAVSKLARQHVTVVLTGEGADELFGGYPRYYIPRLLARVNKTPAFLRVPLLRLMSAAPDHRLRKLSEAASRSRDEVILYNSTAVGRDRALGLLRSPQAALEFRTQCMAAARARGLDEVSVLAELDFQTYLVSILNRQDKMSMAASIEARVPFLDNEVIDLARSLPLAFKQTFRHRKRVLKDVALRYLPSEIVHRRKSGFGVPLQQWFAGSGPMARLLEDTLRSPAIREVLDPAAAQALLAEHRQGVGDHSELLWSILNLQLWRDAFGCSQAAEPLALSGTHSV
ncbi:MAG TPA: asparagine synthase (glutamine-hydrolyzing) [Steroidobacteraceae bacterium]|jgi:asparagine synthase (glutamine-hydrolysing)